MWEYFFLGLLVGWLVARTVRATIRGLGSRINRGLDRVLRAERDGNHRKTHQNLSFCARARGAMSTDCTLDR